ncbi:MAG: SDR family NAD(P)-dependent oxidoreductase [Alphaproteobacteria bacterium]|nr:SDR family NAD(P)-dependent oxidoreductase [Alphaproteobacteria bacterium]
MNDSKKLTGKIALITGASKGIGAAVAKEFAKEGAHVILVARTQASLEEVDDAIRALGGTATLVPLDVNDWTALDHLAMTIFERYGYLDILVGNAAILGTLTPITHINPGEWDKVLSTNLTTNYRLLRSFDPLLRAAPFGRVIFVTSTAGSQIYPYWGSYAVSKAGLDMMVKIYAAEVEHTNIKVNLINPGGTRTSMRAKAFPGENPENLTRPEEVAKLFLDLASETCIKHGDVIAWKDVSKNY